MQLKQHLQIAYHLLSLSQKLINNNDDGEDLDLVDLLEYSLNYSDTTGSSWLYSKDEAIYINNNIANVDKAIRLNYLKTQFLNWLQIKLMEF